MEKRRIATGMSTMIVIEFVIGLVYILGITVTFIGLARSVYGTGPLVFLSLIWPCVWFGLVVGKMYNGLEELHHEAVIRGRKK